MGTLRYVGRAYTILEMIGGAMEELHRWALSGWHSGACYFKWFIRPNSFSGYYEAFVRDGHVIVQNEKMKIGR
eukprot:scaffold1062_cov74-Skeletonema_menzelii.AAC.3